ncbi:glycosyltransferase [Nitrosomonas europaea]|uniref:glycosyltransferase n=1 Tax=Nitrosomonas europaea TaxID=915 RepID=UPI0023F51EB6|nr:glycosyltransferase [Nitrosomonas europaea]
MPEGVRPPLVRYFRAFDVFVGASGYNTCCEVVQAQIPALLVPNTSTKLDDQYRRAHLVAEYAPVTVSDCKSESEREIAVRKLLQLARIHVDRRCLIPMDGAVLAAEAILSILD